jgi:murein L,D-transpeptidase YcbB/YkuD
MNTGFLYILRISFLLFFSGGVKQNQKLNEEELFYPLLVNKFYQQTQNNLFWFAASSAGKELRQALINVIDSSTSYNLIAQPYHNKVLKENIEKIPSDTISLMKTDRIFTDAAIACIKDIYGGYKITPWVTYDQVSSKFTNSDNDYLVSCLSNVQSSVDLINLVNLLQPQDKGYNILKQGMKLEKEKTDKEKIQKLTISLNYFRWIHHFPLPKCIVVNIASAYLRYYENDSVKLLMKVVVGKPSTPTPRFAAYCDQVILYPYWNVPRNITLNELLPQFKRNPSSIDAMNMQVIDANGKIINHYKLNWSSFSSKYFPYSLRQSTGCDNALGVIKFNLTSPYGVFLHDTNNKTAFFSGYRYYSHGCIRIEQPMELANYLLQNRIDTTFLQACYREQKPVPLIPDAAVPVFVVYMPAEVYLSGRIMYYKDVYSLLKNNSR